MNHKNKIHASEVCTATTCTCDLLHVNRPRYSNPCKGGVDCNNANCYFTHPTEREFPTLIYEYCMFGMKCGRASCRFIHPGRHQQDQHMDKKMRKCRWRSNCPNKTGSCVLLGHDEQAPVCRFGTACHNKDNKENPCLWSHIKRQTLCPHGKDCMYAEKCWYVFHTTSKFIKHQKDLAKLIVKRSPSSKPKVND